MALTQQEIDAFSQVKSSVLNLRAEYASVCESIAATEKQLKELPLLPVPLADLKAAILDYVDARGQMYLTENVKPSIASFATYGMSGMAYRYDLLGTPLQFKDLDAAISGNVGAYSRAQLVTAFDKDVFNDVALYAFFSALIKAGLSATMATMTDQDFGYAGLLPEQIGTTRADRRLAIQAAQSQLEALLTTKASLANSLSQLGVIVEGGV